MAARQIAKMNLWVSDCDTAAQTCGDYDLVIDCIDHSYNCDHKIVITPSGKTNHSWTIADLNKIITAALPVMKDGGKVLIHCRRGVSRSAVGAAAILLGSGRSQSVKMALLKSCVDGEPNSQSVKGLSDWLKLRESKAQPSLFV
jgi:hypothetical protein